jgi:hypothetical protein
MHAMNRSDMRNQIVFAIERLALRIDRTRILFRGEMHKPNMTEQRRLSGKMARVRTALPSALQGRILRWPATGLAKAQLMKY